MNKLITQAINEYKECLSIDSENTDSLFFILEDIGTANNMNDRTYQEFCSKVQNELSIQSL